MCWGRRTRLSRSMRRAARRSGATLYEGGSPGNRGITYWESRDRSDRRLIYAPAARCRQLDARTGKPILTFGDQGRVVMRTGSPRVLGGPSGTPGRVFENLFITGSNTGEGYFSPPGDIRAFDVVTGKLVWTFHTIPRPGEFGYDTWPPDAWKYAGGANSWGEILDRREAGHRVRPDRVAHARPLRRRQEGRQSLRQQPARARCAHRQAALALPDGPPRFVGLRPDDGAEADDACRHNGRMVDIVAQPTKTGPALRVRPRHRPAAVADRGARRCRRATCRANTPGRRSRSRRGPSHSDV